MIENIINGVSLMFGGLFIANFLIEHAFYLNRERMIKKYSNYDKETKD